MSGMSAPRVRPEAPHGADGSPTPRRADAERNIATILSTATEQLANRPGVSMAEVARAAGVGRVTLYSHFPSRADLVDAVVGRVIAEAEAALTTARLDDLPPEEALRQMLATSWRVLDRFNRLRVVAQAELGEARLRAHHDHGFGHLERLITRGQEAHAFRDDLPLSWLVSVFYALMHAAGDQVEAGEVSAADVPGLLADSLLPMLQARS